MTDEGGNVLNFETAMSHFRSMFPDLGAPLIETVLRKHDGNVAQTIEELLERSAAADAAGTSCPASTSTSTSNGARATNSTVNGRNGGEWDGDGDEMSKMKEMAKRGTGGGGAWAEANSAVRAGPSSISWAPSVAPSASQPPKRDPCADDEKIALLIQNREFLRYLRHDPHFQRAIIGQHQASARHAHRCPLPPGPFTPSYPIHSHPSHSALSSPFLLSSSRPARSPNTGRFFQRQHRNKQQPWEPEEWPEPVPDGPIVGAHQEREGDGVIPEGPLIDYVDAEGRESGWAGRIKARLGRKTPDGCEPMPASPLVHYTDEQMQTGLQGLLGRGGRGLIEAMASRFSKGQRGGGNRQRMREEEEEMDEGNAKRGVMEWK